MKNALIIFVRNPERGKVKTRLAADVGNEKALDIYKELLQHTFNIASQVKADKFIFYHEKILQHDIWNAFDFHKKLQDSGDLGDKMKTAFQELFTIGYKEVIIIGSDCLQLTPAIIEDGFTMLKENDAVIGPAKDGGYYLLGMGTLQEFIFENKAWSTASVFAQTMANLQQHQLTVGLLPQLTDVDTEEDWLQSKSMHHDL